MKNLLESNDYTMLKLDGKELSVTGIYELAELFQPSGFKEWKKTGKKSKAIALADGTWIFNIPEKEAGAYIWLKMQVKENASSLQDFYRGGDQPDDFGPARKFAKSNQKSKVEYDLFDQKWQMCDIGTFLVSGPDSDTLVDGDRFYFVTSKTVEQEAEKKEKKSLDQETLDVLEHACDELCDSGEWLFYLDARKGEAQGTGGVFIGTVFNPDVDIENIL